MAYNLDLNLTQWFIGSSPVRSSWGCWGKQKSSQLPFFSEPVLLFSRRLLSHMGWPVRFPWINRAIVQWKCGGATFKPIRAFRAGRFNCSSQGWLNSCAMGNHRSQVQFCFFGGLDLIGLNKLLSSLGPKLDSTGVFTSDWCKLFASYHSFAHIGRSKWRVPLFPTAPRFGS